MSLNLAQGGATAQTWYNATAIQTLTTFTCCAWATYNGSAGASPCTLFSGCSTTNGGGYTLGVVINVGTGVLNFYDSGNYSTIRAGALSINTAFFVALVVNGSNWNAYTRYSNESSFTTASGTHSAPVGQAMLSWNFGDHNSVNATWSGKMDKMKLWGSTLTSAQLLNESLFRTPIERWSLLGFWPCDTSATESVAVVNGAGRALAMSYNASGETVDTSQIVTLNNWTIPN